MKRWINEIISDPQRAYRLSVNWMFAIGFAGGLLALGSVLMMR